MALAVTGWSLEWTPAHLFWSAIKAVYVSFHPPSFSLISVFVVVCVPCIPRQAFEKCKSHTQPAMTYKPISISVFSSISFALSRSLPPIDSVAVAVLSGFLHTFITWQHRHNISQLVIRQVNRKMRTSTVFLAAAGLASAVAQSTSTSTVYYDDCTETSGTATSYPTVTATDVITYCPICEDMGMPTFAGGSYTKYTTSYTESCPTGGLQEKTYTITEPCPSSGLDREASTYMPQGFTTTTIPCGCKENTPVPITTPGPAYKSAAANAPAAAPAVATAAPPGGSSPAAAPAEAPASGGSSPAPAEAPASAVSSPASPEEAPATGGSSPAEAPAAAAPASAGAPAEAPASGDSSPAEAAAAAPYPTPAAEGKVASPSGSAAPASNASSITPFTGVASQLASSMSAIVALIMMIPAVAFTL